MFTGVVEVGLFCNMADAAYFGMEVGHFSLAHSEHNMDMMLTRDRTDLS